MFRFVIIFCLPILIACTENNAPKTSIWEVAGSKIERIERVSAIIAKHKALPTAILDAHFVEEQIGDGFLGPSDFRSFFRIKVPPKDVPLWQKIFTPLGEAAEYNAPNRANWWITRDNFGSLKFYKPGILTGRANGWIGVSRQTGNIYIFTFTM